MLRLMLDFVYSLCFFVFKLKTAYEMRISDWSSDVCSSDLCYPTGPNRGHITAAPGKHRPHRFCGACRMTSRFSAAAIAVLFMGWRIRMHPQTPPDKDPGGTNRSRTERKSVV